MDKNNLIISAIALSVLYSCAQPSSKNAEKDGADRPNIIYILADDLGYGDLGCYGQQKIKTPNIDRMASQGMLFTQHYSGCAVCAPSRSSLLTGQHTGHTYIRGNMEVQPEGQEPLAASAITIAEILKQAGYRTGAFGKWGLGMAGTEGSPNKQGFDEFFGYLCQRYAHRYYPEYLWDNDQKFMLDGNDWNNQKTYAPDVIQQRTLEFIRINKGNPFFAYVPMVIPHAELIAPEDSFLNLYNGQLEEKPWGYDNISDDPHRGNDYGSGNFEVRGYAPVNNPRAMFAAMVSRLDHQVGEILNLLNELGIAENTMVIFTSDNGPHQEAGADPDFFNSNSGFRGYKRDLYEGGIRVPMIVKWPAKIKTAAKTAHVSAFWDVLPTLAEATGSGSHDNIDGISFLPVLMGKEFQQQHTSLYWEFHEMGGRQALRKGDWKLVKYNVLVPEKTTVELYNLKTDTKEQNNVAAQHPDIVDELAKIMEQSHEPSEIFKFEPKNLTN
jgi:arylsulfatase A-like enzyme